MFDTMLIPKSVQTHENQKKALRSQNLLQIKSSPKSQISLPSESKQSSGHQTSCFVDPLSMWQIILEKGGLAQQSVVFWWTIWFLLGFIYPVYQGSQTGLPFFGLIPFSSLLNHGNWERSFQLWCMCKISQSLTSKKQLLVLDTVLRY